MDRGDTSCSAASRRCARVGEWDGGGQRSEGRVPCGVLARRGGDARADPPRRAGSGGVRHPRRRLPTWERSRAGAPALWRAGRGFPEELTAPRASRRQRKTAVGVVRSITASSSVPTARPRRGSAGRRASAPSREGRHGAHRGVQGAPEGFERRVPARVDHARVADGRRVPRLFSRRPSHPLNPSPHPARRQPQG